MFVRDVVADYGLASALDCDLLSFYRLSAERYPCFLDSATQYSHSSRLNAAALQNSRYSIVMAFPQQSLRLNGNGQTTLDSEPLKTNFLESLNKLHSAQQSIQCETSLPFSGGWFVYLGYELVAEVEPSVGVHHTDGIVAAAVRIPAALILDHLEQRLSWVDDDFDGAAEDRYRAFKQDLAKAKTLPALAELKVSPPIEERDDIYTSAIEKVKSYIYDGDIFQANLSRKWALDLDADDAVLFNALRKANPAPFAALAKIGEQRIISSSPERLISVKDRLAITRPIAGTHPRANDEGEDAQLANKLIAHPKERAEHVMLIDLERNDLGRICVPGSVKVDDLMTVESYAWVHHIVSGVSGRLREGVTPAEIIKAVFPGGTITGCPKVRCMEIIKELETEARGAYTGSLGYLNHDGSLDLNILIRTVSLSNGTLSLRAGGGIVVDSDPQQELDETRAKARGMLKVFSGD